MPKGRGDIAARSGTKRSWRDYWTEGTIKKIFHDRNVTDIWRASERCSAGVEWEWRGSSAICDFSEQGRGRGKGCEGTTSIGPYSYSLITFIDVLMGNEDLVRIRRSVEME